MRNKLILALTISLFYSLVSFGQVIELTTAYGYQFGAKVNYGPNYLKMNSSDEFRVTLGVETYTGLMAEFSYINMSAELSIRDVLYAPFETTISDLNADWFLIGATKYFKDGKIKPFAGGGLGIVVLTPKNENRGFVNNNLDSSTRFAFSFKAGVNFMFTKTIGLNLQGDLFFPVNWAGVYVGPGGTGISTGSTVILGGFSGGLVFRLDND